MAFNPQDYAPQPNNWFESGITYEGKGRATFADLKVTAAIKISNIYQDVSSPFKNHLSSLEKTNSHLFHPCFTGIKILPIIKKEILMPNWIEVLKTNQLEESKGTTVFVNERDIALYKYEGDFYALDNTCLHRGGQLGDGTMDGPNVICPLHGWDYDVKTGVSRYEPKERIECYPVKVEGDNVMIDADVVPPKPRFTDEYLGLYTRRHDALETDMVDVHHMAKGRHEKVEPMGSERRNYPSFEHLYFLPGQLAVLPLLDHEEVDTAITIGAKANKPLKLRAPIYVSHMSFGALSKEAKMALAKGASMFGTVMCSGEGGMLPDSRELSDQYIFEMASGYFGWTEENIAKADGIEIKMGQSAKAGLGGLLPSEKVRGDIAEVRGLDEGQEARSPARFPDINNLQDMKDRIQWIRSINPEYSGRHQICC